MVTGRVLGMLPTSSRLTHPTPVERVSARIALPNAREVSVKRLFSAFAAVSEPLQRFQMVESKLNIRQSGPCSPPADDLVAVGGQVVLPALG